MSNDDLVQLVAQNESYLAHKAPRDGRVLNALRGVDRAKFIPLQVMDLVTVVEPAYLRAMSEMLDALSSDDLGGILAEQKSSVAKNFPQVCRQMIDAAQEIEVPLRFTRAYYDEPVDIGYGQRCSSPSTVALMEDLLELQEGMNVLEIGAGCGYHAAVTAELVGTEGRVVTIERIPQLVGLARRNLAEQLQNGASCRVTVVYGDGSQGLPEKGPFDRIYMTAGVQMNLGRFDSRVLGKQLKPGGILLYPEEQGDLIKEPYSAPGKRTNRIRYEGFHFVPLRGENS